VATRVLGDWRLIAQTGLALALANARYWTSVTPIVRKELKRWELRAQAIEDPALRALALSKLRDEGFHAEAAAMLTTLAPRTHRRSIVEAIVAVEVLFDYLDGLTERPSPDPLGDGAQLFAALIDAVAFGSPDAETPEVSRGYDGYLESLSRAVAGAIGRLPAAAAVTEVAVRTAEQSAQAQIRMHAAPALGRDQLQGWAATQANETGLGWRELVAGAASSVLVLHALIAAAADPDTTPAVAGEIAAAYLSMGVLLTLLDGLVDYEHDTGPNGAGAAGYLGLYDDPAELSDVLGQAARRAATQARALPNGAHHVMILAGVVAYYGSEAGAQNALARPVVARLRQELAPLVSPTLVIMRGWRSTRRRTRSCGAKGEGES
jgi:tetraprenyl-beta-curcumene synthase